ncbi:MAG: hypothetical protein QXL22_05430 [Candidatus Nezhaarchaeales archaeon]
MLCSTLATFYYSSNNGEDVIAVDASWSISVDNPWGHHVESNNHR